MSHGSGIALAMAVLASCALLVLGGGAMAATPADSAAVRSMTDTDLKLAVTRLDAEASEAGARLLEADAQRDEIVQERDVARLMLAQLLKDLYQDGSSAASGGLLVSVLGSDSIEDAADRVRIAQVVSSHQGNVIRSLDTAERKLDVSQLERARLITRLGVVQRRLVSLRSEQDRRQALRDEQARVRDAKAQDERMERAAAAAADTTPGGLVADAGARVPQPTAGAAPSAALIDMYLASKGSPMAGQGAAFVASGQRWQVDPRLLVAIAGAESNFGQVTCGPNNAWGWACPNDPADFATWAAGIDTVTRGLRGYYLDEGRTSVPLIQQKYCPVGAANDPTGLNSHWATNVTKFLVELGGNPMMVGPGPIGGPALPDIGGLGIVARD